MGKGGRQRFSNFGIRISGFRFQVSVWRYQAVRFLAVMKVRRVERSGWRH